MLAYDHPVAHGAVLGAWTLDLPVTIAVVAAGTAYAVGLRRLRAAGEDWPPGRALSFAAGLLVALASADAWPGVYARGLMSVLVVQACLLLLVAPFLLAYGHAGQLWGLRPPGWTALFANVLIGPLLIPIALGLLVFTPLLGAVVAHDWVADLVGLALLGVGLLVAAPLAADDPATTSLAVGLALFVGLVELLVDAIPGIALRLDDNVLAPVTRLAATRPGGPSPLHDQQLAGAILWGLAELIDLPFLVILFRQWIRADAREALAADAVLDRADLIADLRRPVAEPAPVAGTPWWEKDASVFGDRRAEELRRRGK